MYIADGDYIKDIEVNDLRNRYTLTKGSTQKMVNTCLVIPADSNHRQMQIIRTYIHTQLSLNTLQFMLYARTLLLTWKLDSSRTDCLFGRC